MEVVFFYKSGIAIVDNSTCVECVRTKELDTPERKVSELPTL